MYTYTYTCTLPPTQERSIVTLSYNSYLIRFTSVFLNSSLFLFGCDKSIIVVLALWCPIVGGRPVSWPRLLGGREAGSHDRLRDRLVVRAKT